MQTATNLEIKKNIIKSLDLLPTENLLEIRHFLAKLIGAQLRNEDKITSPTMHHSFRPSLPDLKAQKY